MAKDTTRSTDSWLSHVLSPMSTLLEHLEDTAASADPGTRRAARLEDLVDETEWEPGNLLALLDECDATTERLYGMPLFASESRPARFRFALRHPTRLVFSTKFLRAHKDGGLLRRVRPAAAKKKATADDPVRAIVAAAREATPVNLLLDIRQRDGSSSPAEEMGALGKLLASECRGTDVEVYMPATGGDERTAFVDGGIIAFAAGRLAPGAKIILCGYPDFALSKRGFDAWNARQWQVDNSLHAREHAHLSRAWVLDQTPGVKIWFHDSRRPIRYRELFAEFDRLP
ncbi:protein of unknown function [Beijerinckiaceae bacterium RH AL1]|nr:protein of unknown function [Beijerinckiaceae bacterium RH AL8]VVB42590.1 protein of unknown function [Beijerinckiaceae bacterium RH CH11]VVC53393.1 protein of unknown function [Beijerinckiaceae bacterium RH AL1]